MKYLQLSRDMQAVVDDDDFDRVSNFAWHVHPSGSRNILYARGTIGGVKVYLHRFLTRCPANLVVHHIDDDGLNCTRRNMHLVPAAVNTGFGGGNHGTGESGYRGVTRVGNKWRARIRIDRKDHHIGMFDEAADAARAWDSAAIEAWGLFVKTNFETPEQVAFKLDAANGVEYCADVPF